MVPLRPRTRRRLGLIALALLVVAGLGIGLARWTNWTTWPAGSPGSPENRPPAAEPRQPSCADRVAQMPIRAQLAQRLMVGVNPARPDSARAVVAETGIGGIFIGGNPTDILKGDALAPMRAAGPLPVTVAVDDEGGRVQRIDELDGSIPSARAMAATMTPAQVRELAAKRGRELRARGITMDMAPVVDMTDPGASSGGVIGDRAFGSDPDRVTRYAGAFAAGLRDAGVYPVLKHFPGHGRSSGDSHKGEVTTPPLNALLGADLAPYRNLMAAEPTAVMVGHLIVPGLTDGLPATVSPAAYRLLRGDLGFGGLVYTDDLGAMRAITDRYSLPDAVFAALRAGADVALWTSGEPVPPVLDRLQAAVQSGQLPARDVAAATARVLAAKGVCAPA
ncbi:glycoside hydrolase family 3 N-terminal domain-containing protein [Pseudonocardia acaciae]|uniref:glycoside hydrolase family 3 N-terminal domain-containing protein n=1 Tax=Pseudonocardia acaciae TaxID=551276 RepID=UPI00048F681A|nr:glycoside hydrolase family 3 N-terminal domain-containing protein [Pseudonocardia acaciae]